MQSPHSSPVLDLVITLGMAALWLWSVLDSWARMWPWYTRPSPL